MSISSDLMILFWLFTSLSKFPLLSDANELNFQAIYDNSCFLKKSNSTFGKIFVNISKFACVFFDSNGLFWTYEVPQYTHSRCLNQL